MIQSAVSPSSGEVTATIGFLLTLVSLVGTLFYVHLSNWLRELLEVKAKYELNKVGETESRRQGRIECRFQLRRLFNHVPLLISVVLSVFIALLCGVAQDLIAVAMPRPPVIPYYVRAATFFLIIYFGLTAYLLVHGYLVAFFLHRNLRKQPT